jgi:hypothetical protein
MVIDKPAVFNSHRIQAMVAETMVRVKSNNPKASMTDWSIVIDEGSVTLLVEYRTGDGNWHSSESVKL